MVTIDDVLLAVVSALVYTTVKDERKAVEVAQRLIAFSVEAGKKRGAVDMTEPPENFSSINMGRIN